MKLEEWTSIASLGMSAMFVALLLSFYNFLIGPDGQGPGSVVDPGALILQNIFISAAPSVVLGGFAFGMTKSFGNRLVGIMIIAAGIVMIAGMFAAVPMLERIDDQYIVGVVGAAPYFFMAAGIGMMAVGGYVIAATKRKRIRSDLDDLL